MYNFNRRWSRLVLMWVMVCIIILPSVGVAQAAGNDYIFNEDSDIAGHWAEGVMSDWIDKGWISGYLDGSFRPDQPVTRAEMAALIGRHLDIPSNVSGISFHDVDPHAWYAAGIGKLVALDAASGYEDGSFRPNRKITRQEAAVLLAGMMGLTGDGEGVLDLFADSLPVWSRSAVQAVQGFGWMVGDTAGTFRPRSNMTRAETVSALDKMFRQLSPQRELVLDQAGIYGPGQGRVGIDNDVELKASGVHLRQVDVFGQLTVGEEVGDGDAELTNVRVKGKTFIRGGGRNSIYLNGTELTETVIAKETGKVRVVASDETTIEQLDMNTPTIFELDSGEIGLLVIGEKAAGTVITLAEGTVIRKLIVYGAPVEFKGAGTIEEAEIYAEPVTFEHPPLSMSCGEGVGSICSQTASDDRDGSNDGDDSEREQPTVTKLVYDPISVVLEGLGSVESIELLAIWTNSSQRNVTSEAVWTSENESVVSVNDGEVTSVGYGDTNVRAEYQGYAVRMPVSVVPTVTSLVYDLDSLSFQESWDPQQIGLEANFSDGSTLDVTNAAIWTSGNPSVVTVGDSGMVSPIGAGNTVVSAVYGGQTANIPVEVRVMLTGLRSSAGDSLEIDGANDQITIQLFAEYSDGSELDVTGDADWSSGNDNVATVNDSGTVTPIALGETVITASYSGFDMDISVSVQVEFSGGEGTVLEPYTITTASQLNGLKFYTSELSEDIYFELTGDIDLSNADFIDETEGWVPIGTETDPFKGTLNGNGNVIANLQIDRPNQSNQGLFGYLNGTVMDLHLESVSIIGKNNVGALAGELSGGTVQGVTASGRIETEMTLLSGSNAGGLIGYAVGSEIVDSGSEVNVTGVDHNLGGLVGYAIGTTIETSYAHGDIIGNGPDAINIGGLVGYMNISSTIQDSYTTGTVNGINDRNGGLVGGMSGISITNAYAAGTVNAPNNGSSGGLVGLLNIGTIVDSFYTDVQFGEGLDKGKAITGADLEDESTFTNVGWDFVNIWTMDTDLGRPALRWE